MELAVKQVQIPERIEFNYEELKNEILELTAKYSGIAYTEDQIKEAKADKAKLTKLKKTMNDERIRLEREYMAPFTEFKTQVADLISIVDGPIREIDGQLKRYEEARKAAKKEEILAYIDSIGGVPGDIDPEKIFNPKWLNATYNTNAIRGEIDATFAQIPVTPADPPETREPELEEGRAPRQWVSFAALLTVHQARMLRAFFETNGIEFKAI